MNKERVLAINSDIAIIAAEKRRFACGNADGSDGEKLIRFVELFVYGKLCPLRLVYDACVSVYAFLFAAHVDNEVYLGRALERLGDAALKEQEPDIGAAFLKFAVVTKELSALMKTLVSIDL